MGIKANQKYPKVFFRYPSSMFMNTKSLKENSLNTSQRKIFTKSSTSVYVYMYVYHHMHLYVLYVGVVGCGTSFSNLLGIIKCYWHIGMKIMHLLAGNTELILWPVFQVSFPQLS